MGYTAPTTRATSYLVTAANWNQELVDNMIFLANPPACRVYHNAAQSIANNTDTVVAFNTERYDTDTMHPTVTNNSRITFTTAGLYLLTFNGEFTNAADYTQVFAYFRLNAGAFIGFSDSGTANVVNEIRAMNVATVYKFAAADYVEVLVKHINGAAAARNLSSVGNRSPEVTATWLGLG